MRGRAGAEILSPSALTLVQEAFDAILIERNLPRDSEEADYLAYRLIRAYQGGHDTIEKLRAVLKDGGSLA